METPNTGWSLLPLACQMVDMVGIGWKDVIVRIVDQRVDPLFEFILIELVHGVKYDAHEALNGKVAGLVGLKPLGIYTRCLYESFSEPQDAFRSEE